MTCRHCRAPLRLPLIDLGSAPPSNAYLTADALRQPERWFPLRVLVCEQCWLAQTEDVVAASDLFDASYAYFSSTSATWLHHAEAYAADMTTRFGLGPSSHVVEVAANDGYLLQFFAARGVPCTGVEPTASTAAAARAKGLGVIEAFFGAGLAERMTAEGRQADLTAANNVLAHVPDIDDFVAGFRLLLKPAGVATFEFPSLLRLVADNQFDTIYHEHFSYLSLTAVDRIFAAGGLRVFDVEELPTHGGSLRVFAGRADAGTQPVSPRVAAQLDREAAAGMRTASYYAGLQQRAERAKDDFLRFLLDTRRDGKRVAAYGAAAKGNTLLNFAGVRRDLIPFVIDKAEAKQGKFLPGSRIPIISPASARAERPDYLVILPWNIADEVKQENAHLAAAGTRFVTAIPSIHVA